MKSIDRPRFIQNLKYYIIIIFLFVIVQLIIVFTHSIIIKTVTISAVQSIEKLAVSGSMELAVHRTSAFKSGLSAHEEIQLGGNRLLLNRICFVYCSTIGPNYTIGTGAAARRQTSPLTSPSHTPRPPYPLIIINFEEVRSLDYVQLLCKYLRPHASHFSVFVCYLSSNRIFENSKTKLNIHLYIDGHRQCP